MARLPAIDAPETLRAFLAVEIPEALRERCAAIGRRLAREMNDVSWVKAANLHLTLKFLGNARPAQIARLAESLAHKAAKIEPFDLELAGIGCFPSARRARVIWIGVGDGGDLLRRLAEKAEGAGEKAGFARESRPFSGHLTLGRVRMPKSPVRGAGRSDPGGGLPRRADAPIRHVDAGSGNGDLSALIAREDPGVLGRFRVSEVVLMQSHLHPGGAIHTPLHRVPLGRQPSG